MHTERLLSNKEYVQPECTISDEAAIVSEFANALLDWRPVSTTLLDWGEAYNRARVQDWLLRRDQILRDYPPAFWFLVRVEAEGLVFLKQTFQALADERNVSRQHIQQEFEQIMRVLARHDKRIADAVWAYREHKLNSERPDDQGRAKTEKVTQTCVNRS